MKRYRIFTKILILAAMGSVLAGCQKTQSSDNIFTSEETGAETDSTEGTTENAVIYNEVEVKPDTKEWSESNINGLGKYFYPDFELTYTEIDGERHRCLTDESGNYIIFIGSEYDADYKMNSDEKELLRLNISSIIRIGTKESESDIKWPYEVGNTSGPAVLKCQLNGEGAKEIILKGAVTGGGDEWTSVLIFDTDNMREIDIGQSGDLREELIEAVGLQEGYSCGRAVNFYTENDRMFAVISIDKINENAIQNDTEKYYSVQLHYNADTKRMDLQEEGTYISCDEYEKLIVGNDETLCSAWSEYGKYIEEKYAGQIDENDIKVKEYLRKIKDSSDGYECACVWRDYCRYLEFMALTD